MCVKLNEPHATSHGNFDGCTVDIAKLVNHHNSQDFLVSVTHRVGMSPNSDIPNFWDPQTEYRFGIRIFNMGGDNTFVQVYNLSDQGSWMQSCRKKTPNNTMYPLRDTPVSLLYMHPSPEHYTTTSIVQGIMVECDKVQVLDNEMVREEVDVCPVCQINWLDLVRDSPPNVLQGCGHALCRGCLGRLQQTPNRSLRNKCPVCRNVFKTTTEPKLLTTALQALHVPLKKRKVEIDPNFDVLAPPAVQVRTATHLHSNIIASSSPTYTPTSPTSRSPYDPTYIPGHDDDDDDW